MAYLTPDNIPDEYLWKFIRVPNDLALIGALSGAISELAKEWKWEQFGDASPEEVSEAMLQMLIRYLNWEGNLIGSMVMYAGLQPPNGTLKCDGTVYLASQFPELHDYLSGTLFVLGDAYFVTPYVEFAGEDPLLSLYDWAIVAGRSLAPTPVFGFGFFPETTPSYDAINDGDPAMLGVRFTSDIDGHITGIQYWKPPTAGNGHIGYLFSDVGVILIQADFPDDTSGWITAQFPTPYPIEEGSFYVAAVYNPDGISAQTQNYFTSDVVSGHLTAPADNVSGQRNGRFAIAAAGTFPNLGFNAINFYVDVSFFPD